MEVHRKRRGVLVLPDHLSLFASDLTRKNFFVIVLPIDGLDRERRERWLTHRTLVTDQPDQLEVDDLPELEFSVIDISQILERDATLADEIGALWTTLALRNDRVFVLRLLPGGKHEIEFPS
jgi:hypothetical protein